MNLTDKERLLKWAIENCSEQARKDFFLDESKTSYYTKRDNEHCIEAYSWQTVQELMMKLDEIWRGDAVMQEVEKVVVASAMKERQKKQENSKMIPEEYDLPEYVYVF